MPAAFINQARAFLESAIIPQPVQSNNKPVAGPYQIVDVNDAPEKPSHRTGEAERSHRHDGRFTADGGKISIMLIRKWTWRFGMFDAGRDQTANMLAHLLRGGSYTRYKLPIGASHMRSVSDRKDVGRIRNGEVQLDFDAPR